MRVKTLYLARHGRTLLNAEGRLRGLADPGLDDVGLAEARLLADALTGSGAQLVASSRLARARLTARAVAAALDVPLVVDSGLLDRDYGPQTGERKENVEARWGSLDRAPGVEEAAVVLARTRAALAGIFARPGVDTAVVVTHDAVIRPFLHWVNPDLADVAIPTGSWCRVVAADDAWHADLLDQRPGVDPAAQRGVALAG